MGPAGWTFLGLTVGMNLCILLLLAVYEAYKARTLGEEYSESSGLGLALFCWLQLVLVVAPVLFLIEEDSVGPRYFLSVSLVFACCMSMLLFIFVSLMMKVRRHERQPSPRGFSNFQMPSARLFASTRWRSKRNLSAPSDAHIAATNADQEQRRAVSMMTTIPFSEQSEGPPKDKSAQGNVSKEVVQMLDSFSNDPDSSIQGSERDLPTTEKSEQASNQVEKEGGNNGSSNPKSES
jgi:hypothetical protein